MLLPASCFEDDHGRQEGERIDHDTATRTGCIQTWNFMLLDKPYVRRSRSHRRQRLWWSITMLDTNLCAYWRLAGPLGVHCQSEVAVRNLAETGASEAIIYYNKVYTHTQGCIVLLNSERRTPEVRPLTIHRPDEISHCTSSSLSVCVRIRYRFKDVSLKNT